MSMVSSIVGLFEPRGKKICYQPTTTPVAVELLRKEGVIIPNRKFRDIYRIQVNPGGKPVLCQGYPTEDKVPLTLKEGLDVIREDRNLQRKNIIVAGTQMSFQGIWRDVMIGPCDDGLCVGCAIEREQQGLYLCWK